MGRDEEGEVAQNLRTKSVTQSDIFEPDQVLAPFDRRYSRKPAGRELAPAKDYRSPRTTPSPCAAFMVSDSLTVGL